ncbi:MAG: 50S ribosomal protein L30 [bacterium]|nr:50S ribosomal protein L30 [bacterium]
MTTKSVKVTQTRSNIRGNGRNLRTLEALGLGRVGRVKEHRLNDSVAGMIKSIAHLVTVEEVK